MRPLPSSSDSGRSRSPSPSARGQSTSTTATTLTLTTTTTTTSTTAHCATTSTSESRGVTTTTTMVSISGSGPVGFDTSAPVKSAAQRFVEAARNRDEQALGDLIRIGCDINQIDDEGNALHALARLGDHRGIALLCKHKALISMPDQELRTPLMLAARFGKPEAVAVLLGLGAEVNLSAPMGGTALYFAVKANCLASVELLCKAGSALDAQAGQEKNTPLHIAARIGNLAMVAMLVAYGATMDVLDDAGMTPFHHAAAAGHKDILIFLKDKACNIRHAGQAHQVNAMDLAADGGHLEVIRLLHGWGFSACGSSGEEHEVPMWKAAIKGQAEAMSLLVELGAFRPKRNALLRLCVLEGHAQATELLLAWGDDPNAVHTPSHGGAKETALWLAVKFGNAETVRVLLAHGARLDHPDHPEPLLIQAAVQGKIDTADLLLTEYAADINAVDRRGFTALMTAAYMGKVDMVRFLIGRGAKLDLCLGVPPRTALDHAVSLGEAGVVREFAAHGRRPSAEQVRSGMKAAIAEENPAMVEVLIELGYAPSQLDLNSALAPVKRNGLIVGLLVKELAGAGATLTVQDPKSFFNALLAADKEARAQSGKDRKQRGNILETWLAKQGVSFALWAPLSRALDKFHGALPYLGDAPGELQKVIWFSTFLLGLTEPDVQSPYPARKNEALAGQLRVGALTQYEELLALAEAGARLCIVELNKTHSYCIANTTLDPQEREVIAATVHRRSALMMPLANLYADCWITAVEKAGELEIKAPARSLNKPVEAQLLPVVAKELQSLVGRPGFASARPEGVLPQAYDAILAAQMDLFEAYRAQLEQHLAPPDQPQAPVTDYA